MRGVLYSYNKSVGIYRCPGDKNTVANHPEILRTRTYQLSTPLNGYINGVPEPPVLQHHKTKESELLTPPPVQLFTFIDPHPACADGSLFSITKALIWSSPMDTRSASPGVGAARPRIRCRAILRSRTRLTEAIGNAWPTRRRGDPSELQLKRVGARQPNRKGTQHLVARTLDQLRAVEIPRADGAQMDGRGSSANP
jgi:hypothetical protein